METRLNKYVLKSNNFRIYPATCGWSNAIQNHYAWTQFFFNTEKKISVLENTRLRVDEALIYSGLQSYLTKYILVKNLSF